MATGTAPRVPGLAGFRRTDILDQAQMSHCILNIALDTPLNSCFDYRWPCTAGDEPRVGQLALVNFGRRDVVGLIVEVKDETDVPADKLKDALAVRSQLALVWGVETFLVPTVEHTDERVRQVDHAMLSLGRMQVGELVTIVAGSPPSKSGSTNAMRVWRLGDELPGWSDER